MRGHAHAVRLADKLRPQHTALAIVDMQNDFLASGGASDLAGKPVMRLQAAVPPLVELLARARDAGVVVTYITSAYGVAGSAELSETWLEQAARRGDRRYVELPMCATGTWGARVADALGPASGDIVVTKHRFGAFHGTNLDDILRARHIRTLVVSGVLTHVCVHATAMEAFSRDYYTVVPGDCVADWTDELHGVALQMIDTLYGQVVQSAEIIEAWMCRDVRQDSVGTAATARAQR